MSLSTLHGLYGITDSKLMPDDAQMLAQVEAALQGGMTILQYRDKSGDQAKRLRQANALRALCHRYKALFLINDDSELAKACQADGVHLGQSDGSVPKARQLLGSEAIIGVTCHDSLSLAEQAVAEGADYVAFGAFFPSKTKPDAKPAPHSLLADAGQQLDLPIVAIGGITVDNAHQLIDAGADMVAVIHALFAAEDIPQRARAFQQLFSNDSME